MPAATSTTASPRERLLAAASEGFFRHGVTALGVAELCARADVRKGSFYYWFDSKEALVIAVLEQSWARMRAQLTGSVFSPDRAVAESFQAYAHLLRESLAYRDGEVLGCRYGNAGADLAVSSPEAREVLAGIFDELTGIFESAIARAVRTGELRDSSDPARAARAVCAQMEGVMLLARTHQDPTFVDDFVPAVRMLVGLT